MSEKRFKYVLGDGFSDGFIHLSATEVCELLNEQQTEITELREAIDYLKTVIRYTIPNQMVADVFKHIGEDYE